MFKHKKMTEEEMMHYHSRRLCVGGVAVAAGIVNGVGMLLLAWLAAYDFGVPIVHIVGSIYKGFGPGIHGALWGFLWGFVDAFIAGLLFAWLYNIIVRWCGCCCKCTTKDVKKSHKV